MDGTQHHWTRAAPSRPANNQPLGGPPVGLAGHLPCRHHHHPKEVEADPEVRPREARHRPNVTGQSPEASDATQDQPDSQHSPACPAPRDSGMQPPCAPQPVDPQVAAIQDIADQLTRMQQEAKAYQAAAARDREANRQEMLRRTAAAQPAPGPSHPDLALTRPPYPPANSGHELRRTTAAQPAPGPSHQDSAQPRHRQLSAASGASATQPAPPSTQGYAAPAATHTRDRPAAATASAQPTGPPGSDILPDGDEMFANFVPPQFAVPTHSIGEEQLRRAGLDPQLLQQMADPAAALWANAHSSQQANLILRGMGLADLATTGGLTQKPSDNPPLTAQWPHKKVWLAKTGHWAEYDDLTVEQFVHGYIEIVLPTIPQGPATKIARDHIGYLQTMMRDTSSSPWHLVRSTHKQILLMVEHKQLKWEDALTRDSIRAAQLLLAKEEAIQAKLLDLPTKSAPKTGNKQQQSKEELIQPCHSYNSGTLHVCAHCFRHGNHHLRHKESACNRKGGKA